MSFQDKSLQCSDCGQNSSPLLPENKNSIHAVALRMNLSVVPSAAEQERHSVTEVLATATRHDGKRFWLLDTR